MRLSQSTGWIGRFVDPPVPDVPAVAAVLQCRAPRSHRPESGAIYAGGKIGSSPMTAHPPLSLRVLFPRLVLPLALLVACAAVWAQDRASTLAPVTISAKANREPAEKSYRRMVRGMDLFERRHALAPDATLRFKLLPRHRDTDMRDIELNVLGTNAEMSVPVAPDNTFVLQRDQRALAENAMVVPDRRRGTMTWRTEVRTPGLPPQTRRLGDLRLECEVGMEAGLVSNHRSLFDRVLGAVVQTPSYCAGKDPRYLFFSDQPLFGVALVSGQRRETLPVGQLYAAASDDPAYKDDLPFCDCEVLLDRSYFLPLGDRSWPDDTLVEFEFMAGGGVNEGQRVGPIVPGRSTRADVAAAFAQATQIRFDSGYEVWVDKDKPPRRRRQDEENVEVAERVILVDPSGLVTRARLRLPSATH
jgi:uncharacterized lipoprotein YbaY